MKTSASAKQLILEAYEQIAEKYNELIDHKPHNAYYDRPNTLALMPEVKGKTVLDAACGPGKYAEVLIAAGAAVTWFDISPKMVELARTRNNGRGRFFIHDLAEPLHMISDQSCDVLLCALALHYVQDWTLTMQEFFRVLKPDGVLVLSMEHPFNDYLYFKSDDYFSTENVSCVWNGFGGPVRVNSFRRSLQECILPLTGNGFYIDKIVEPKPTKEFEKLDPRHFRELNSFPAFMCIRAVKKNNQEG